MDSFHDLFRDIGVVSCSFLARTLLTEIKISCTSVTNLSHDLHKIAAGTFTPLYQIPPENGKMSVVGACFSLESAASVTASEYTYRVL